MTTGGVRAYAFQACCKWWHQNQNENKVVKDFTMRMVTGWTQWESLAANRRSLERPRAGRGTIRKAPRKYKNLFQRSKKIQLSGSIYMFEKKREERLKRMAA